MGDWFASENNVYTKEQIEWLCRKKTWWEKLKGFLGTGKTVEKHFELDYPYPLNNESEDK